MEKASRCAAIRNLDSGPSVSQAPCSDSEDFCDASFFALAGVPLGHLAKVAADSAIVFRGEKGPVLSSLRPSRQKKSWRATSQPLVPARRQLLRKPPPLHLAVPVVMSTLRPTLVRSVVVLGLALLNYAVLLALLPLLGPGRTR